jgi:hypothetical protein
MLELELQSLLQLIKEKIEEIQHLNFHSFKELLDEKYRPKKGVLNFCGVYIIYEDNKPIYVGAAGNGRHFLRYSIGDLFADYKTKTGEIKYYHTLTRKL